MFVLAEPCRPVAEGGPGLIGFSSRVWGLRRLALVADAQGEGITVAFWWFEWFCVLAPCMLLLDALVCIYYGGFGR